MTAEACRAPGEEKGLRAELSGPQRGRPFCMAAGVPPGLWGGSQPGSARGEGWKLPRGPGDEKGLGREAQGSQS